MSREAAQAGAGFSFDWSELAFGSKKPLRDLKAVFIAAPRELSQKRFKQLVKEYLTQGNIVLGIAKESYVDGFEEQPQFRMLEEKTVSSVIAQVGTSNSPHKIYTLRYFQRELPYILEKIPFKKAVLVNGSWKHVFHLSAAYYMLTSRRTPYEMVSPFTDEAEARKYEKDTDDKIFARLNLLDYVKKDGNYLYTEQELLQIAAASATCSYDYSFQTGLALAKHAETGTDGAPKYRLIVHAYNRVVPYQTYAMLHGSSREKHFSPPNDLNHYDTIHAEVKLLIEALRARQHDDADLSDTTLFINLMPCPPCARMLSQTGIAEFVYTMDHSDGYAVKMLEAAGKKVRRVVL